MLPSLTLQQRAERCTCGRFLAWLRIPDGFAPPRCCKCMGEPADCTCPPTEQPAEGCWATDFERVAEPKSDDPDCE